MTSTATKATSATVESRIPRTVESGFSPFHPKPAALGKIRAVALALGCSESSAHKKLYGPHSTNLETAAILEVLIRRGDTQDAAAFEAPITAAMMGESLPPLNDAVYNHNTADACEDLGQAEFVKNAGDQELNLWIKKLAGDLHAAEILLACLEAEREKRREAKP